MVVLFLEKKSLLISFFCSEVAVTVFIGKPIRVKISVPHGYAGKPSPLSPLLSG